MALWLYATLDGVGSVRALGRLCEEHDAYRWLCGGVSVNYHSLADFRVAHGEFLDQQLAVSVATLESEGLVEMKRVAQDGVRIRASAGAASFRRKPTLEECLLDAEEQ
ncbi:MAG: IS5/IS1182 family transposase, partial [Gammaproteobacteria bacterium]|nr:IS5/IS1182 family transposase [Gammaproteobacteria bacterium]